MKYLKQIRITIILLIAIICTPSIMFAQGIKFEKNLSEALVKAKAENKLVFVDFYTSWCGPCKAMAANTFPQEIVGTFYNKNFINCQVQCDDKGEGVELGKKYQVNAYPTLMYLNKEGEMVHSVAGGLSPKEFIELGKDALSPDKNLLFVIRNWNSGKQDFESAKKYFSTLKSAYRSEKASSDFIQYFNKLSTNDKISKNTFELIKVVGPGPTTPVFTYLENNLKKYARAVDSAQVYKYVAKGYSGYLHGFIDSDKEEDYKAAVANFKTKHFAFEDEVLMYVNVYETLLHKPFDTKEYQKRGTEFLDKYGLKDDGYTLSLTSLLGNCTGAYNVGAAGITWMENLMKRNPDPRYLNTYFYILWRNYRWDEAFKVGDQLRAYYIKTNRSTEDHDKQVKSLQEYRVKWEKKEADKKAAAQKAAETKS